MMPVTPTAALPADDPAAEIEGYAPRYGLDFFRRIFEVLDYDEMNEIAAYGGFPDPLPALALRHGVRAARQELRVRPVEDLRDGDQQRPLLRLPARGATRWSIRSW